MPRNSIKRRISGMIRYVTNEGTISEIKVRKKQNTTAKTTASIIATIARDTASKGFPNWVSAISSSISDCVSLLPLEQMIPKNITAAIRMT